MKIRCRSEIKSSPTGTASDFSCYAAEEINKVVPDVKRLFVDKKKPVVTYENFIEMCNRVLGSDRIKSKTKLRLKKLLLEAKIIVGTSPNDSAAEVATVEQQKVVEAENLENTDLAKTGQQIVVEKETEDGIFIIDNLSAATVKPPNDEQQANDVTDELTAAVAAAAAGENLPKIIIDEHNSEIDLITPVIDEHGDLIAKLEGEAEDEKYVNSDVEDKPTTGCFSFFGRIFRRKNGRNRKRIPASALNIEPTEESVPEESGRRLTHFWSNMAIIILAIVLYCFGICCC